MSATKLPSTGTRDKALSQEGQSSGGMEGGQGGWITVKTGEDGGAEFIEGLVSLDRQCCSILVQWEATEEHKQGVK